MPHWKDVPRFADIRTVADYRAMTVAWLRGEIDDLPSHDGPPSAETEAIRGALISMNESGFLTIESQPGTYRQRAHVEGFATHTLALSLWRACNGADLIAMLTPIEDFDPGAQIPFGIPVTVHDGDTVVLGAGNIVHDGDPVTFAGRGASDFEFLLATSIPDEELQNYTHVDLIDPTWGRNDALISTILDVLEAIDVQYASGSDPA